MLPSHVTLVEVGPRDGLQNEQPPVDAATKIELVRRLEHAGRAQPQRLGQCPTRLQADTEGRPEPVAGRGSSVGQLPTSAGIVVHQARTQRTQPVVTDQQRAGRGRYCDTEDVAVDAGGGLASRGSHGRPPFVGILLVSDALASAAAQRCSTGTDLGALRVDDGDAYTLGAKVDAGECTVSISARSTRRTRGPGGAVPRVGTRGTVGMGGTVGKLTARHRPRYHALHLTVAMSRIDITLSW